MRHATYLRRGLAAVIAAALAVLLSAPLAAIAGTTGTISGVVTDAGTGAPIANVKVAAASPSGSRSTITNSAGFYSLQQMIPDTYTVSFQAEAYQAASVPGITVQQDLTTRLDQRLAKTLKTIASVRSASAGNLLKPYTGTDVYNVSGAQLNAATGGDNLHRTVYEYLETVPGVTPIGGAYPAEPSIRGGYDVDNGYELDGIPITERVTGFFTTNLTDLGISNVEVYTGGLGANNAGNGMGVINSVIKSGTYPGFGSLSLGVSGPDYGHFARAEYGGATQDKRYSWYFAMDSANTQTTYWAGGAQPSFPITQLGISLANPAYIYTRDVIANVHYKPDTRNDIQFFYQNGVYDGLSNYGVNYPQQYALAPCPGAVSAANSSNATGGVAPNGATCPLGLYIYGLSSGQGDRTGHYSGIGKIQWNHIINSTSSVSIRLAENFNQYIFDQKFSDPNSPINNLSTGGTAVDPGCPQYPYALGGPLPANDASSTNPYGTSAGSECTFDLGDYWQSRRAHQYYAQLDYTSTPNENVQYKAGFGQEFDYSIRDVRYLNLFDFPGRRRHTCASFAFDYPCHNALTDIPTHVPYAYAQASFNVGHFTLEPGIRQSTIFYGIGPEFGGPKSTAFIAPSFLGTYRINPANTLRFSYAESAQFIGTEFVYRLHHPTYNPLVNSEQSYEPQINHVTDLQWEHQFDPNTSLKVGPYYRATNNYLGFFTPFLGFNSAGVPKFGDTELKSGLKIRALGAELGFSHVDNRDTGASVWLSGSYNNYWTQVSAFTGGQISFVNFPLLTNFLDQGIYVRGYQTPLFSGTLTMDLHSHGWHLLPVIYYSYDNFFNSGACIDPTLLPSPPVNDCQSAVEDTGTTPVLAPEQAGMGYWYVNTTLLKDLNKHYTIGIRVSNLTNNQHGTTPCLSDGTGCYPFNGPQSNFTSAPNTYVYQPITQDPRRIEGFLNIRF
ncbi:MAG TPA: carboxypeptidase regulatory-like domain-containing protein [Candidatus Baltobacteraceae bacterium]|nr:carboxypeptidase regulatory-like domain-containing protein [Candidatus Baltobacteraceae bacterium]